eukprot:GHVL01024012.1.p1 GENE.GHVL01024012.1~~GHVL01024012.1.p1  ORF type:complete len:515 (-),score=115.32 GHVL01024012.1:63-1607(-)
MNDCQKRPQTATPLDHMSGSPLDVSQSRRNLNTASAGMQSVLQSLTEADLMDSVSLPLENCEEKIFIVICQIAKLCKDDKEQFSGKWEDAVDFISEENTIHSLNNFQNAVEDGKIKAKDVSKYADSVLSLEPLAGSISKSLHSFIENAKMFIISREELNTGDPSNTKSIEPVCPEESQAVTDTATSNKEKNSPNKKNLNTERNENTPVGGASKPGRKLVSATTVKRASNTGGGGSVIKPRPTTTPKSGVPLSATKSEKTVSRRRKSAEGSIDPNIQPISPPRLSSLMPQEYRPSKEYQECTNVKDAQQWKAELARLRREIRDIKSKGLSTKWNVDRQEKTTAKMFKQQLEKDYMMYKAEMETTMKLCDAEKRMDERNETLTAHKEDLAFKKTCKLRLHELEKQMLLQKLEDDRDNAEWELKLLMDKKNADKEHLKEQKDSVSEIREIKSMSKKHEKILEENERNFSNQLDLDFQYRQLLKEREMALNNASMIEESSNRDMNQELFAAFAASGQL